MKRIKFLILIASMLLITGCNKTPKEKAIQDKYTEILKSDSTISNTEALEQAEEYIEKQGLYNEDGSMKTPEEMYEPPKRIYDWRYYTSADKAIQIDDMLLIPGSSLEEVMKQIEDAEIYSYEYNEDKITTYDHEEIIPIYKGEQLWFTIYAQSYFDDETITVPNCLVKTIEPSDAALKYLRFVDGTLYDEFLEMEYDDIVEFIETYYPEGEWNVREFSSTYTKDDVQYESIEFDISQDYFHSLMRTTGWTGKRLSSLTDAYFYIDADTKKCIDVKFYPATHWRIIDDTEYENMFLDIESAESENEE